MILNPTNVVIKGECNRCGSCCRDLILVDDDKIVRTESDFNRLKQKFPQYQIFSIKTVNKDGDLVFRCRCLTEDNTCSIHPQRPGICINYPAKEIIKRGGRLFQNCGFSAQPIVDFNDLLQTQ